MKLNKKVELLAPAKDKQTVIAAIDCGADAVYIGAPKFGARQNASNSLEDIKEIVEYAHKFNVHVHITLNTILTDEELQEAEKLINELYKINVDAIIVQDMGILELAIEGKLPPIEIHASTQCDNRTIEKVKFFQKIGVKRVILARELSICQIEKICQTVRESDFNSDMEIETFIHGALCISYSGQCYLSTSIGGRSANRGECAQPCRKKYTLIDEDGKIYAKNKHLLSLKDFNASTHIQKLINAGVKSFKIEGRLKDVNYVKNVVAYYRKEIDKYSQKTSSGKVFLDFEPNLSKSFNRGFTDYFLPCVLGNKKDRPKNIYNLDTPKSLGEKIGKVEQVGKDFFVIKNIELNSQDGLCYFDKGELCGCLVNKIENARIYPNNIGNIKQGTIIYRNFDSKFEKQLINSKTQRKLGVKFKYEKNILIATDEDGISVELPLSKSEEPKNPEKMRETFINQLSKSGNSDFYVINVEIITSLPFMAVSSINQVRREILAKLIQKRIENYEFSIQNPLNFSEFPNKLYDYHANIFNDKAKLFYQNCGCKVSEYALEKTNNFKNKELMRTKHCLKSVFNICGKNKKMYLVDEKGKKYNLIFDCKNCEMIILN